MALLLDLFFSFLYPFLALPLFFAWLLDPEHRREWAERAGFLKDLPEPDKPHLWIHVSSAGELITALPFIKKYLALHPSQILLTIFNRDTLRIAEKESIFQNVHFLPMENPVAYRRLLARYRIEKVFFFETEIWPLLLSILKRKKIPAFLINAQIYDRNFASYLRLRFLLKPLLAAYRFVFTQTENDSRKFLALGIPETGLKTVGSLKYDLEIKTPAEPEGLFAKYALPKEEDALIFTAGSTHPVEDIEIMEAAASLQPISGGKIKKVVCVIAPRDTARTASLVAWLKEKNLPYVKRSSREEIKTPFSFYLLDSLGELREVYAISDLVFVGGSLIPYGGHNLLEPLALGKKTLTGPHAFHFQNVLENLGEWIRVVKAPELRSVLAAALREGKPKPDFAPKFKIDAVLRGAAERILKILP